MGLKSNLLLNKFPLALNLLKNEFSTLLTVKHFYSYYGKGKAKMVILKKSVISTIKLNGNKSHLIITFLMNIKHLIGMSNSICLWYSNHY